MLRCFNDTRRPACAAVCLLSLLVAGCGGDFVPVSGRVTQGGKPIGDAVVTFQPVGSKNSPAPEAAGSVGRTDAEGRYSLRVISPDRAGAAVGEHAVTISVSPGESKGKSVKLPALSKAWHDGSKRFTVPPGGTSAADFDIK